MKYYSHAAEEIVEIVKNAGSLSVNDIQRIIRSNHAHKIVKRLIDSGALVVVGHGKSKTRGRPARLLGVGQTQLPSKKTRELKGRCSFSPLQDMIIALFVGQNEMTLAEIAKAIDRRQENISMVLMRMVVNGKLKRRRLGHMTNDVYRYSLP